MLALLGLRAPTTLGCRATLVIVVVVVMGLQDALSQLLLPPVDIRVQLVSVLANRKLLVVVDWDVNTACAYGLILRVVELGHIGVSQGLLGRQSATRVELQQVAEHIEGVI